MSKPLAMQQMLCRYHDQLYRAENQFKTNQSRRLTNRLSELNRGFTNTMRDVLELMRNDKKENR